jgi:ElaB/YqjD/DUF883 family membrane-anchored ribosome-binding protein
MSDEREPEVIKQEMEETRASLTEKVGALETQVVNTVQSATTAVSDTVAEVKTAVQDTVETVRDTVKNTVESVGEAFDVRQQMAKRPVVVLGVSTALGFLAGRLFHRMVAGPAYHHAAPPRPVSFTSPPSGGGAADGGSHGGGWTDKISSIGHEWLDQLGRKFSKELSEISDLAVATVSSHLKDVVTEGLPKLFTKSEDSAAGPGVPPGHTVDESGYAGSESAWSGPQAKGDDFSHPEWRSEFTR